MPKLFSKNSKGKLCWEMFLIYCEDTRRKCTKSWRTRLEERGLFNIYLNCAHMWKRVWLANDHRKKKPIRRQLVTTEHGILRSSDFILMFVTVTQDAWRFIRRSDGREVALSSYLHIHRTTNGRSVTSTAFRVPSAFYCPWCGCQRSENTRTSEETAVEN